jgi:hypothetical protein
MNSDVLYRTFIFLLYNPRERIEILFSFYPYLICVPEMPALFRHMSVAVDSFLYR